MGQSDTNLVVFTALLSFQKDASIFLRGRQCYAILLMQLAQSRSSNVTSWQLVVQLCLKKGAGWTDGWRRRQGACGHRLEERCVKSRRGLEGFIEWYNIALQMLLPLIVNVTEIHLHFASQNEAAQCCFSVLSAPSPSQLRLSSNNNLQWRKWSLHLGYQYSIHSYS